MVSPCPMCGGAVIVDAGMEVVFGREAWCVTVLCPLDGLMRLHWGRTAAVALCGARYGWELFADECREMS